MVISDGRYAAEVLSDGFETQPAEDGSFTPARCGEPQKAVHPGADDRLSGALRGKESFLALSVSLCSTAPPKGEPLAKQTLHGLPKALPLGELALRSND